MSNLPNLNRQFLAFVITLLFVGIIISGSMYTSHQTQKELSKYLQEDIQVQESQVAQTVAKTLQAEVTSIQEKLELITRLPRIQDPSSSEDCNIQLEDVFEELSRKIGNLGRVNSDGIFECSLNKALINLPAQQLGPYITDIFTDPDHKVVMSRIIHPPGSPGHLLAIHVPVFTPQGEFDGTLGGAIYMNELKEKYFKDIRLTPNGHFVLLDDNGDILYHPYSELVGKNYASDEFKKYASPEVYAKIIEMGKQGNTYTERYVFDHEEKIGAAAPVEIFPNRTWIVLVTTPVKDIEEKLLHLHINETFQNFITFNSFIIMVSAAIFIFFILKNIQELVKFNKELKHLDTLKDDFVSVASHELRTPMTAIKGIASMIFDEDYGKTPAYLKQPLKDIITATERLIILVNDLLNVGRIEAGRTKFTLTTVSIKEIVKQVVTLLTPLAEEKGISIEITHLPSNVVQTDVDKLQEVLHNLVGNALKFTDKGKITLSGEVEKDSLIILITDSGIGISPEDQEKLFGKFQQLSSQKQGRPAGTGLGLFISRELIRKMGGDLWIEKSQVGVGTTFAFSLPLAKSHKAHIIKRGLEKEAKIHPDQK